MKGQNNALFFDGVSDHVILPYKPSLDFGPADKFTVEFWFRTTQYYGALISTNIGYNNKSGFEIAVVTGKLEVDLLNNTSSSGNIKVTSLNPVNDSQWHHVAFVYHGSSATVKQHLYIDGNLQPFYLQSNLSGPFSNGNGICIGARGGAATAFFGEMDEVRIWGTDFCPGDIIARKDNELTGSEPALLAYFNFNEGIAGGTNTGINLLPDLSPSNITGTLTGFSYTGVTSNWVTGAPVNGTCFVVPGNVAIKMLGGSSGTVCTGNTTTLIAYGGPGVSSYSWSGGPQTASFVVSPTVQCVYTVSSSGSTMCPGTNSVLIGVVPLVTVTPLIPAAVCPGQSVLLTATGADNYIWQPGNFTGSNVLVFPPISTTYTVTGASVFGCKDDAPVFVNIDPGQDMFAVIPPPICARQNVTLSIGGAGSYTWQPGNFSEDENVIQPDETTSYTADAVSTSGCHFLMVVTVTVLPTPLIYASSSGPSCPGASLTLAANGANNYTWQPGGMNGFYITVQPTTTTTYTVYGTATSKCISEAQLTQVVLDCNADAIAEQSLKGLIVYPNPFEDVISLSGQNLNGSYQISDLTGRIIKRFEYLQSQIVIDLHELPSGCYFLRPDVPSDTRITRLIKN
jgi:hypothetical protein